MKALIEVVKLNADVITTSTPACGVENNAGSQDCDLD